MLLATSRICARPVTFYNNFDKYNGRERPQGNLVLSNVLQLPTGSVGNSSPFSNVWLRDFDQWTEELSSVEFRGITWNFEAIGGLEPIWWIRSACR